ncbi:hypothetical protein AZE42_04664 [Rhizopogon vesiculosus]|uniref:NADP-dependent oxidoreductase domain-containing protein n=1 Tax=Rhizopogon vesiculosus TaxID=180088 RepID=A0A1J8PPZ6_9AGAM|nr:hypothetical protein AZE42_04664 [Rhizopogon vesiculosus]
MTFVTTSLGGTASDITVGKVAHGLMLMTWRTEPVPDEQCFEAIKAGVDALPPGAKMFINGGRSRASDIQIWRTETWLKGTRLLASFTLLHHAKELLIWITRPAGVRRSVELINEKLRGTKRLDLYECARIDPKVPLEESIRALVELKKEGKLDHIGMSECSADSLRRGNAIHPIAAVEIEVSPWSYEEEGKKVIATAEELGIAVIAYSPLGRGFLTGQIKRPEDLPEGDFRRTLPRFQEDNIKHNFAIVDALTAIAERKNVTSAQLSIAWVGSLGKHVIPLPGSSHPKRTLENCAGGDVGLSTEDLAEINSVIDSAEIRGTRYAHKALLWG